MTSSDEGPTVDPIYGDMFGPQQHEISKELMDIMMRLPALLEQQFDGTEGPVDVLAEQTVEMLRNAVLKLMHFVPQLAGALDIARARLTRLEARVAEMEDGPN